MDGNYRFVDILDEEIALQERPSRPGEALPPTPTGAEPLSPAAEPLVEEAPAEEG